MLFRSPKRNQKLVELIYLRTCADHHAFTYSNKEVKAHGTQPAMYVGLHVARDVRCTCAGHGVEEMIDWIKDVTAPIRNSQGFVREGVG